MSAGSANNTAASGQAVDLLESHEARLLIESGRQSGRLAAEDIARIFDELDVDAAQLDEFYSTLDELQIEVVERGGRRRGRGGRRPRQTAEVSTDTLQLFLKDIGRVSRC